jgi:small subunit ribosomal protein S1
MGESFAALFEAEAKNKPRKGAGRGYQTGESVEGTVVRVGRDAVFLALDGKQEGYIESIELAGETVNVGDVLRAVVVKAGEDSIRLGRVAPKGRGTEGLAQARDAGLPVEGVVSGVNKGGLEVTVDGVRAFCPARQVDKGFVADLNTFVGQKLEFLVTKVDNRDVVLSRRALLDRKADEAREKLAGKLVAGAVLEGRVSSIRDFGAFIDLGGVEGLLPGSELSHDRSLKPADVVKVGDAVTVQVIKVDSGDDKKQKITLSLKAMSGDPWESLAKDLAEGSVREGRVVRTAQFGAFVQLAPGLDGLLHVSELSGELDAQGQPKLPAVGDAISVRILKVDLEQRRIALAPSDAKPRAQRLAALAQGAIVTGKVSAVEKFGVFVQIDGQNARGLLPAAEIEKRGGDLHKQYPVGTAVRAKVVAIDGAGKIRLSVTAADQQDERNTFEDYRARENERSKSNVGSLGAKLQAALKKK